jgi:hypothetical protein
VVLKDHASTLVKKGKNHIAVAIQNATLSANFAFRLVESTKMLEVIAQGEGETKAKGDKETKGHKKAK